MEELGWRGFLLPMLQRYLTPVSAILLISLLHSLWHAPVFVIGQFAHFGTELPFAMALLRFSAQILAITIILSVAWNASRGSLTLAWLIHLMLNLAYPWDSDVDTFTGQTLVLCAVALLMLAVCRRHLRSENAHKEVIPPLPAGKAH